MIDKKISSEFQNNGVVLLKKIIDQKWIEELRKGIEYNFQNPSEYKCVYEKLDDKEIFYDDYCNWNRIAEYRTFIFNSNISKINKFSWKIKKIEIFSENLKNEKVLNFGDDEKELFSIIKNYKLFDQLIKEKGSKKRTPWHQDQG